MEECSESNEEQFYFSPVVWVAIFFLPPLFIAYAKRTALRWPRSKQTHPPRAVQHLGKANAFSFI